ncbi:MAG: cytidine deaminase [Verrucomicrobiae bacterium]|nr:cytidine deaminase [Verrucomicrobiae bacterium]
MSESDSTISLTLPALSIPDTSQETDSGRLVIPGQSIPEKRISIQPSLVADLRGLAREAAKSAYCPYSRFHVGAALVMADDPQSRLFSGCNVENASYGGTVCAERNAIFSAAAAGFRRLGVILVSTVDSLNGPVGDRSPCGICRQVIREFADERTLIVIDAGDEGLLGNVLDIDRLLPWGFQLEKS